MHDWIHNYWHLGWFLCWVRRTLMTQPLMLSHMGWFAGGTRCLIGFWGLPGKQRGCSCWGSFSRVRALSVVLWFGKYQRFCLCLFRGCMRGIFVVNCRLKRCSRIVFGRLLLSKIFICRLCSGFSGWFWGWFGRTVWPRSRIFPWTQGIFYSFHLCTSQCLRLSSIWRCTHIGANTMWYFCILCYLLYNTQYLWLVNNTFLLLHRWYSNGLFGRQKQRKWIKISWWACGGRLLWGVFEWGTWSCRGNWRRCCGGVFGLRGIRIGCRCWRGGCTRTGCTC